MLIFFTTVAFFLLNKNNPIKKKFSFLKDYKNWMIFNEITIKHERNQSWNFKNVIFPFQICTHPMQEFHCIYNIYW